MGGHRKECRRGPVFTPRNTRTRERAHPGTEVVEQRARPALSWTMTGEKRDRPGIVCSPPASQPAKGRTPASLLDPVQWEIKLNSHWHPLAFLAGDPLRARSGTGLLSPSFPPALGASPPNWRDSSP